jgi:hypothetical protein
MQDCVKHWMISFCTLIITLYVGGVDSSDKSHCYVLMRQNFAWEKIFIL